MTTLLDLTIKMTAILLVAFLLARCWRSPSAAVRHWVLAVALASAAAMPILGLVAPSLARAGMASLCREHDGSSRLHFRSGRCSGARTVDGRAGRRRGREPSSHECLSDVARMAGCDRPATDDLAWRHRGVSGCAARRILAPEMDCLPFDARGRWRVERRCCRIGRRYGLSREPVLLQSDHPSLVATWGVLRPQVMLPSGARTWPEERVRIVLAHELAHIRRRDWLLQIGAELLRSIYWFNPVLWLGCSRLRHESEQACDDAVLSLDIEPSAYARHLVELARSLSRAAPSVAAGCRHCASFEP